MNYGHLQNVFLKKGYTQYIGVRKIIEYILIESFVERCWQCNFIMMLQSSTECFSCNSEIVAFIIIYTWLHKIIRIYEKSICYFNVL